MNPPTNFETALEGGTRSVSGATFKSILFSYVRLSLVHPSEAQLHQLDRLIEFYGEDRFAKQLKQLARDAKNPHISRGFERRSPFVFSGSTVGQPVVGPVEPASPATPPQLAVGFGSPSPDGLIIRIFG